MAVFFVKSNGTTYPKGRALIQMYRVVHITKRGNSLKAALKPICISGCFYWLGNSKR